MKTTKMLALLLVCGAAAHYGDPCGGGCGSDEKPISVTDVAGSFCSPSCTSTACPTDIPTGATASPQCALTLSTTGDKYCALLCSPTAFIKDQKVADAACGDGASCKPIQGKGLCTYDDCGPSPAPTPPPAPTPAPTPLPPGASAWFNTGLMRTLITGVAAVSDTTAMFTDGNNGGKLCSVMKTVDGGAKWNELNVSAGTIMLGIAAQSANSAATIGALGAKYTTDGEHFKDSVIAGSLLGSALSSVQRLPSKLKYAITGNFGGASGVAISGTDGLLYNKAIDVANKTGLNGTKYAASFSAFPTDTTWYVTMGSAPAKQVRGGPKV